jgi:hypothetical protein
MSTEPRPDSISIRPAVGFWVIELTKGNTTEMASSKETFERIMLKAERADKHIDDLARKIATFENSSPYTFSHQDDTECSKRTFYIHITKEIPNEFSLIIGDAIHNMRSALDHLATHLVDIGIPPKVKNPYYPIFETSKKYEAGKMGKIEGARPVAIKAIDATQPYKGGDGRPLLDLHTLNNSDKHRLVIPAWGGLLAHTHPKSEKEHLEEILGVTFKGRIKQGWLKAATGPIHLKDGDKILTMPIAELQDYMSFRIGIVFGEPEIVKGKQILPTLMNMSRIVQDIIRVRFYESGLL